MDDPIAVAHLLVVLESDIERSALAAVGRPYQAATGEWRCAVELSGLHERLADMAGQDSLQALCMAASMLRNLLEAVREKGGDVLHPSDRSECQLDAIFGRLGSNGNAA